MQRGARARCQIRPREVDGRTVPRVDGDRDVRAEPLLADEREPRHVAAGADEPARGAVARVREVAERRRAARPVVIPHDHDVADERARAGGRARGAEGCVDGPVGMGRGAHRRRVLRRRRAEPGRRPGLDAVDREVRRRRGRRADAVERAVDGRGAADRCAGGARPVVAADVDMVEPCSRAGEPRPRLDPGLIGTSGRRLTVDEHGHRGARGEVGRAEDVQPQRGGGPPQDPGVERARRGDPDRDVPGADERVRARHDRRERPCRAAVGRDVDRRVRVRREVGSERRPRNPLRVERVDRDVRLAVLVLLPAPVVRDHVDDDEWHALFLLCRSRLTIPTSG